MKPNGKIVKRNGKTSAQKKRPKNGPVKVGMPFEEAIRRAVLIPPPPEGWAALDPTGQLAKSRRKQAS